MVFHEKLLKKHSLKLILKPLIDDLIKLENGIVFSGSETRAVKCGVLCYSADNLEASLLGDFSERDICRVCHIKHQDLVDRITDEHSLWSVEEYDNICKSMVANESVHDRSITEERVEQVHHDDGELFYESSDDDSFDIIEAEPGFSDDIDMRGVRQECPLNVLQSFLFVTSFLLDLMHDLFEGKFNIFGGKSTICLGFTTIVPRFKLIPDSDLTIYQMVIFVRQRKRKYSY